MKRPSCNRQCGSPVFTLKFLMVTVIATKKGVTVVSKTAKTIMRLTGFGLIAGGAFGGLASSWSWGLIFFGLAAIIFSGGFG